MYLYKDHDGELIFVSEGCGCCEQIYPAHELSIEEFAENIYCVIDCIDAQVDLLVEAYQLFLDKVGGKDEA